MIETPIARCQAIKVKDGNSGKGRFITFLIKDFDSLPSEEFYTDLLNLSCGKVVNLYVTIEGEQDA